MSQFTLPIPNRALGVVKRPFALPAAFAFSVLIFLIMFLALAWWQGPGLWRDWQINQNPLTVEDWDLIKGECSSSRGLTDCDAHVTYRFDGKDYEKDITLAFFDLSSDDYLVELVIDADNPDLATLSLGLEMIWNRLIVFSLFMLLFGGGVLVMLINALQGMAANRAAAQPGRLSLVPVDIIEVRSVGGRNIASYSGLVGERRKRTMRTAFAKGQEPLVGVDENGKQMGLAVRLDYTAMPILLDSRLERIEMADSERQAALSAFRAEQETRGVDQSGMAVAKKNGINPVLRGLMAAGGVLILAVIAVFGYWVYYVTSASDAFDSLGIEINNVMPEALNSWGCEQLYKRFGDERAPFGCVSSEDWESWRVVPGKTKVK